MCVCVFVGVSCLILLHVVVAGFMMFFFVFSVWGLEFLFVCSLNPNLGCFLRTHWLAFCGRSYRSWYSPKDSPIGFQKIQDDYSLRLSEVGFSPLKHETMPAILIASDRLWACVGLPLVLWCFQFAGTTNIAVRQTMNQRNLAHNPALPRAPEAHVGPNHAEDPLLVEASKMLPSLQGQKNLDAQLVQAGRSL